MIIPELHEGLKSQTTTIIKTISLDKDIIVTLTHLFLQLLKQEIAVKILILLLSV